ncbi:MAG: hypothetical protein CO108_31145 [Deltaproteobacteria bacterium CG_4_9_14_3_um_filter_63_12]|nr:MAG: hypothetical protein CO108_31145 [Deltaproteobacteria bacterium CG_4_9_14_3_um_filter_63_12]
MAPLIEDDLRVDVRIREAHMSRSSWKILALFALSLVWSAACSEAEPAGPEEGIDPAYFDEEYGKPMLGEAPAPTKADDASGRKGLSVAVDKADTAVWEVKNQWADKDTPNARKAGIAWAANSGLSWDQKYSVWIDSMVKIPGHETYYETYELSTPWGKSVPAPSLECAESSIFLRVTFASWYNLPFFMEAVDGAGKRVYFGHFGARTADGVYQKTANYRTAYRDYSNMTAADIAREGWPKDEKLRARKIYGTASDDQPAIGPDAHAGAYFDEVFLNKRVGYFMMLMLTYFGSVNLADANNTFNIIPEATLPGDTLLERWQKKGIGHTLVVKHVEALPAGKMEAQLVSGSMPRRQPKWEDGASSKRTFTLEATGGAGENYDGDAYAKLGGGIKRWRVAQNVGGQWTNGILPDYQDKWIPNYEYDRIAARPAQFEELLGEVTPEQLQAVLLQTISDQREHLRRYPASCSARTRREEAFKELYKLNSERLNISKATTDKQFRMFEDYVLAELVYETSKTCCWNSSTSAMFDIVMDYNQKHAYDETTQTCNGTTVFMARDSDYALFREHAISLGRGAEWLPWTEDETCPQSSVANDTEAVHEGTLFCSIAAQLLHPEVPVACGDAYEGNSTQASAAALTAGSYDLQLCANTNDWYSINAAAGATLTVTITFTHANGDLDLKLVSAEGNTLVESTGSSDEETVTLTVPSAGDYFVNIFGYSGAANDYRMLVQM